MMANDLESRYSQGYFYVLRTRVVEVITKAQRPLADYEIAHEMGIKNPCFAEELYYAGFVPGSNGLYSLD
jgi:hypothetical protein